MMPPHSVQEPTVQELRNASEDFLYLTCQHGSEDKLKAFLTAKGSPLRLAFSRPGLLTFKAVGASGKLFLAQQKHLQTPASCLIRTCGISIAKLSGGSSHELVEKLLDLPDVDWGAIHIFERDQQLPGQRGYEVGRSELADEAARLTRATLQRRFEVPSGSQAEQDASTTSSLPEVNTICSLGTRVVDVVLVEPDQWLVGWHQTRNVSDCWPGGIYPVSPPAEVVSRAYFKAAESIAWSQLPIGPGDRVVEIGSSPGGACQRLLDLGCHVTGIDPAEMNPLVANHPRFEHWRAKAAAVRRKKYANFRWLMADANVAPNYTLDVVEDIVRYPTSRLEGLILTLKLSDYDLLDGLEDYRQRMRSWGFQQVDFRQLATNRREICAVAANPIGSSKKHAKGRRSSTAKRPPASGKRTQRKSPRSSRQRE